MSSFEKLFRRALLADLQHRDRFGTCRNFDPARQALDARTVTCAAERYRSAVRTSTRSPVLMEIAGLVEVALARTAYALAATMTAADWSNGRPIVLEEQRGAVQVEYGEELFELLALEQMRTFYRPGHTQLAAGEGAR